jgi:molecular chaperone DnaK (HSP70)
MPQNIAIDFGTTNTIIARWNPDTQTAETIELPGISAPQTSLLPPLIPSLVHVQNGSRPEFQIGAVVQDQQLDIQASNRLFRNFKRGIVAAPPPPMRNIDGVDFGVRAIGQAFLKHLVESLPYAPEDIGQLVLTTPIASFESYLGWLTLDLSLVQLPKSRETTGGILKSLLMRHDAEESAARVIAKAGHTLGGSDVDQWLLDFVLEKTGTSREQIGDQLTPLLTRIEQGKIQLSSHPETQISLNGKTDPVDIAVSQNDLQTILRARGFHESIRQAVEQVLYNARQKGIYKEDIQHVLMVGGTSLIPSVKEQVAEIFPQATLRADKPFTAIAEGALRVSLGQGLDDYIFRSYGLRYLNPQTGKHDYDEIIPMESPYPTDKPVEVILGAAHEDQNEIEFVLAALDTEAVEMVETEQQDGQTVFLASASEASDELVPIHGKVVIPLDPPGQPGEDRLRARFQVDENRQVLVSVEDLKTKKTLVENEKITTLR